MNQSRRQFVNRSVLVLGILGSGLIQLLAPLKAFGRERSPAFAAYNLDAALSEFFPGETIKPSDKLTIDVNDVIENGAVVPLAIKSGLPNVHSITILVEKNPNPLIANFKLHPLCQGFIETRIKMGESSDIIAVIRADDQLYSTRKFVEVIAGGCG
ncbi:MAG TPA: thiosulfate oxidation carrier protein SoxY [Gammaproteobacteria bacterium]